MWLYITRRLLWLPVLLFAASLVTFILGRFGPGDPVQVILGNRYEPGSAVTENLRAELGLDKPFAVQYAAGNTEIFPSGDSRALARGLRRVLDGGGEIETRVQRLRDKVHELDWELKTTEFLDYLRQRGIEVPAGQPEDLKEEIEA